jgi:hypothetical protein
MAGQGRIMEATVERVLDRVRESLLDIERRYRATGRSVTDLGIDEVARRMASAVPAPSPVNEHIGPFYRTDQVVSLLGITRQAVSERLGKRTLLGVKTREGVWVYPVYQFENRGILPGLPEVLRSFDRRSDRWAVAAWLVSKDARLGGERPIDRIRAGVELDRVKFLARDASRRWLS